MAIIGALTTCSFFVTAPVSLGAWAAALPGLCLWWDWSKAPSRRGSCTRTAGQKATGWRRQSPEIRPSTGGSTSCVAASWRKDNKAVRSVSTQTHRTGAFKKKKKISPSRKQQPFLWLLRAKFLDYAAHFHRKKEMNYVEHLCYFMRLYITCRNSEKLWLQELAGSSRTQVIKLPEEKRLLCYWMCLCPEENKRNGKTTPIPSQSVCAYLILAAVQSLHRAQPSSTDSSMALTIMKRDVQ